MRASLSKLVHVFRSLRRLVIIASMFLLICWTGNAKASVYDLAADWNTTTNPNGYWTYVVNGAVAQAGTRAGDSFAYPPGAPAIWSEDAANTWLGWSKSNGSESSNGWNLVTGDIYGHTPSYQTDATKGIEIDWKSPVSGQVSITGGTWMLRDVERSVNWQLTVGSTILDSGILFSGDAYSRSNPDSISSLLNVNAGDVIRFRAYSPDTPGDYIGLSLQIGCTIPIDALSLSPGWNFISFPKLPVNNDVAAVLADVSSNIEVVWGYDNENKTWKKWKPGDGSNTLMTIEPTKGYWIYMGSQGYVDTTGWTSPGSTAVPLYNGWNLIGYLGSDHTDVGYALSTSPVAWVVAWGWESNQWYGKHATINALPAPIQPLLFMNQGKAYWIKVRSGQSTDWTPRSPSYSNASFAGPWLCSSTGNEDIYVISDGSGTVTDYSGFNAAGGSYQVQPNGALSLTLNFTTESGPGSAQITGLITSPVTAIATGATTGAMDKITDLSACAGTWSGTLAEAGGATSGITFTVNENGIVTAFSGLGTTATGKMFCQAGKVVARFITGLIPIIDPYNQFSLNGTRAGNSITGTLWIDNGPGVDGTFTLTKQ